jgi:hypothetical protein
MGFKSRRLLNPKVVKLDNGANGGLRACGEMSKCKQ